MPNSTEDLSPDLESSEDAEASAEGQLYDLITNDPVKDTPMERVLQAVARSLVEEYEFDHTQLQRDQTVALKDQAQALLVRGVGNGLISRQEHQETALHPGVFSTTIRI